MKLLNSFSLNMLPSLSETVIFNQVDSVPHSVWDGLESCIGHADLARLLGVQYNRANVQLKRGEKFVIAQYIGPRLPEGTTKLPDGASIRFVVGEVYQEPTEMEKYLDE